MYNPAARLVRAHLEFCKSWGQTQWFLLVRHDLCRTYFDKFFYIDQY